jgi:hypothetical protein
MERVLERVRAADARWRVTGPYRFYDWDWSGRALIRGTTSGRAADALRSCTTVSAWARFSTAATSPSDATRSRDRRLRPPIEFHGEDTNLGRRLTPIGRVACAGLLGVDVGAALSRDGEAAVFGVYVRNFWSEILRHRPPTRSTST